MADEPKVAEATVEAPKAATKVEPMTAEQFLDKAMALIKEGEAAGLNPYGLLLRLGVRRGSGWLDSAFAALQNGNAPVVKK